MSKNNLVTEDYLKKTLSTFKIELKSELLEIKEEIIGEIKNMKEEFDTHQYSHTRINDDLQEHDERIGKLESAKQ